MSGVRSSCEASARKRRSVARARSSAAEHAVQRLRQLAHLVAGRRHREAATGVARPLDLPRGGGQPAQRAQAAPRHQRHGERAEQRGARRRDDQECAQPPQRPVDLVRRRGDDHRAAGGLAARPGERRDVETDPLAGERGVGVATAAAGQRRPFQRAAGQDLPAQRGRARDDPAARIDDLDGELAAAEGLLERARLGQHGRRGGAEAGDVGGPAAQRGVQRGAQLVRGEDREGEPGGRHGDDHGERGGEDEAGAQAEPAHRRRTNPAPRTV